MDENVARSVFLVLFFTSIFDEIDHPTHTIGCYNGIKVHSRSVHSYIQKEVSRHEIINLNHDDLCLDGQCSRVCRFSD
jgi:hypothetical protein